MALDICFQRKSKTIEFHIEYKRFQGQTEFIVSSTIFIQTPRKKQINSQNRITIKNP